MNQQAAADNSQSSGVQVTPTTDNDLQDAISKHEILPVERRGNTLIIIPSGDLTGFSRTVFDPELNRVKQYIQQSQTENVIVDLSQAPYFGSEMIGAFVSISQMVGDGGEVVMCEPSNDMQVILEKMRITAAVPLYKTRAEAERQLVTRSWRDYVKPMKRMALISVIILACYGTWYAFTRTTVFASVIGTQDSRAYSTVLSHYEAMRSAAEAKPDRKVWQRISRETDEDLFPMVSDSASVQLQKQLFAAAKDLWQAAQNKAPPGHERLASLRNAINEARIAIEKESGLSLSAPKLPKQSAL